MAAITEHVRRRVLRWFARSGLLEPEAARDMLGWAHGGFSLDAAVRIAGPDRAGLERLLRDCARPPLALGRLVQINPHQGIVGALLFGRWALGLARDTAATLLDAEDTEGLEQQIRSRLEALGDTQVCDLHLWRVGAESLACTVSLVTHAPMPLDVYRDLITPLPSIDHLNIEVQRCDDARCSTRGPSSGAEG